MRLRIRDIGLGVDTAKIEMGSIQSVVTATGNLNPVVNVQVGSQVSGNIQALYADFNTRVTKGQLIAQIDPSIFESEVDAAAATVRQQESAVTAAEAQIAKAEADAGAVNGSLKNAEAIVMKDTATLQNLELQWNRANGLYEQSVVSKEFRDSAQAVYAAAVAQVDADHSQVEAAKLNLTAAQANIRTVQEQRRSAAAQLQQSQAALRQASINLEHTRIVAPVSGTVIARHFDVGQTVAASFQAPDIFDIGEDLTKMQVDTSVDEADVGVVQTGQSATFTVDAYPGRTFQGTVFSVRRAPITAQNVVTYDVVVTVPNQDLKLFPGMTAKVTIFTAKQDRVLRVVNAALRYSPSVAVTKAIGPMGSAKGDAARLYLVSGEAVTVVPVVPGLTDGRYTAVTSNLLKVGDEVIVRDSPDKSTSAAPGPPGRRPF
ncbi:efflux RND transporter periplasmic adaptor subunit [Terriglobus roseus]|nr:efflux RND transporter periplasmic adaptor subunit [Terriglobus roseus]